MKVSLSLEEEEGEDKEKLLAHFPLAIHLQNFLSLSRE
jgi:hypothetical protein